MLDEYRHLRHDAMEFARIYKQRDNLGMVQFHVNRAKQWHDLVMRFWQAEKDEHNQVADIMRKYGIQKG